MTWKMFECERCHNMCLGPTIEYSDMVQNIFWCSEVCFNLYLDTFIKCSRCQRPIIYHDFEQILDGKHYCCYYCLEYRNVEIKI